LLTRLLIAFVIFVSAVLAIDQGGASLPEDGADVVMSIEFDPEPSLQAPEPANDPETHAASLVPGRLPAIGPGERWNAAADQAVSRPPDPWRPPPRA